ncbi:MAG: MFS transporter [Anaerolineales bacterium]|nr:MFS transporter [Anaerolineales bacterium]MCB0013074.1 MFS transporter [Anaerolineales bacterium]MCB0018847.1 MFS transporter [Anaerolineales bacterium]MCB0026325.1 MFS transporter [Anaerolineales bacterium]MCB8960084.1 MFS transporter [Ardenticatenales bacterium]
MSRQAPLQSFLILRQPQLLRLWLSRLLSAFGDRFFDIAVVWLSVQIVGSEVGFVLAAGSVTRLLGGLLGGVYADRWDRQKILISADVLRALSIFSLPVAALLGEITLLHLAIVAAIEGGLSSLFDPALQASLPVLTDKIQDLQALNALLDVTHRMARIFAPGLAGLLIAVMPLPQFFTLDAVTFLVSALAIFTLGRGYRWQPEQGDHARGFRGFVGDISGAFQLVNQRKPVLWSLLSYIPGNIVWAGVVMVGLALYADNIGAGVRGYSFLITAYGTGSVLSNLIVGSRLVENRARFLFAGVVLLGLGFLVVGSSSSFVVALLGMFIASTGTPMSDLMMLLMIQQEFPANQVGKVYSLRLVISSFGYSLGLLLAAPLFRWFPVQPTILVYAGLLTMVGLAGWATFRRPPAGLPTPELP